MSEQVGKGKEKQSAVQNSAPDDSAPVSREEQLALAAFLIAEQEGFPEGRELDHWLAAEGKLAKENESETSNA